MSSDISGNSSLESLDIPPLPPDYNTVISSDPSIFPPPGRVNPSPSLHSRSASDYQVRKTAPPSLPDRLTLTTQSSCPPSLPTTPRPTQFSQDLIRKKSKDWDTLRCADEDVRKTLTPGDIQETPALTPLIGENNDAVYGNADIPNTSDGLAGN